MWCKQENIISEKILAKILQNSKLIAKKNEKRHFVKNGKNFFFKYQNFKLLKNLLIDIIEKLNLKKDINNFVVDHAYLLYKSSAKNKSGNKTHAHQDISYWRNKKNADTMFTIWIPLEKINEKKGCLVLIKKNKFNFNDNNKLNSKPVNLDHFVDINDLGFNKKLTKEAEKYFKKQELEEVICKSGDLIIFDCFEPHSSMPNYSGKTRKAMKIVLGRKITGGFADLTKVLQCKNYFDFFIIKSKYLIIKYLNFFKNLMPLKKPVI